MKNQICVSVLQSLTGCLFAALLVLLTPQVYAQEVAVTHCAGSCPQYNSSFTAGNSKIVIHHLYAAGLNNYSRRADWVAYRLTRDAIGVASLLPRDWQPDRLADFSAVAELADLEPDALPDVARSVSPYGGITEPVRNEQNRVRLAPLTSFAGTPYWSELNNTSNMLPMPSPLRLGAWLRLEQTLNSMLADKDEIHVITGPVYFENAAPGSASLEPGLNLAGYFKIIKTDSGIASFIFPHDMRQQASFCQGMAGIDEIERLTQLEFFPDGGHTRSGHLVEELGCSPKG